jgi:hypothetical protein
VHIHTCARWPALLVAPFIAPSERPLVSLRVYIAGRLIVDRKPDGVCTPLRLVGRRPAHFTRDALCACSLSLSFTIMRRPQLGRHPTKDCAVFPFSKKWRGIFHVLLELGLVCFVREIIRTLKIGNFWGFVPFCMLTNVLGKNYIVISGIHN